MLITSAEINGFKNLSGISFVPDKKYNIITGKNAQGKTNLLESLWILSGCRSFRGSKEKDYINCDSNRLSAEIKILDSVREQKIRLDMSRDSGKSFTLNGVKQKGTASVFDAFRCICFIPDDVDIIKGSPEKRRNFVDMAYSQLNPASMAYISRNNSLMNHRNALLKSIMQGRQTTDALEVWDRQASAVGAEISFLRNSYVAKINQICSSLYKRLSGGNEELTLEYKSNVYKPDDFASMSMADAVEKYFGRLCESADYDIRTGSTHAGVNRDDVLIRINGRSARDFGSQGQIKSTALVMKLAQAEIFMRKSKDAPVVFLDDVMGELDEYRQRFIFDIIRDMQVFLTTPNENAVLPGIKGKILRMEKGRLL